MTIGIYCIEHVESGKKYVGKSVEIERRLASHKYQLNKCPRDKKTNLHLWNAVQKHGWGAFKTYVLQEFDVVDEELIGLAELEWMDKLRTCERDFGYNLRRDTSTKMITHPETIARLSVSQRARYSHPYLGDLERELSGDRTRLAWSKMSDERKRSIGEAASSRLRKYHYAQCDLKGKPIVIWRSTDELKSYYPKINIQNVHSVSDGHKATYMGFIWEKTDPRKSSDSLLFSGIAPEIDWSKKTNPPHWEVLCIDPHEGVVKSYSSVEEAAERNGVSYGYMSNCVNGRVEHIDGYIFKKVRATHLELQDERKRSKSYIFEDDDLCI